ncbi:MAG: hypothetical protein SFW36_23480 [Leptolyngbyaceae cyanobacterium bins.59]|nr:hypothetical protein [Leptolyngbyaceae cyanobacterium bins.59]
MATSDDFKRELKAGDLTRALKLALSDAIELKITTWVVPANGGGLEADESKPIDESQPGYRMRTRINILDGDIETEVGPQFLANGPYTELRGFHIEQVRQGREIIQKNLQGIQRLFNMLVDVTYGDPTVPPPLLPEGTTPPLPPAAGVPSGRILEPARPPRSAEPGPEFPSVVSEADVPPISDPSAIFDDPDGTFDNSSGVFDEPDLSPDSPGALGDIMTEPEGLAEAEPFEIPDLMAEEFLDSEVPEEVSEAILEEPDVGDALLGDLEGGFDSIPPDSSEIMPDDLLAEFALPEEAEGTDPFAEAGNPPDDFCADPAAPDLTVPSAVLGVVGAIGAIGTSDDPSMGLDLPEPTETEAEESLAALFTDDESADELTDTDLPFPEEGSAETDLSFPEESFLEAGFDLSADASSEANVSWSNEGAAEPDLSLPDESFLEAGFDLTEDQPAAPDLFFPDEEASETNLFLEEGNFGTIEESFADPTPADPIDSANSFLGRLEEAAPLDFETPESSLASSEVPLDDLFNEVPTGELLGNLNPGDETALASMFGEEATPESPELSEADFVDLETPAVPGVHPAADIPAEDDAVLTALFTDESLIDAVIELPVETIGEPLPTEGISFPEEPPSFEVSGDLAGLFEIEDSLEEDATLFVQEEADAAAFETGIEDSDAADLFEASIAEEAPLDFSLSLEEETPSETALTSLFEEPVEVEEVPLSPDTYATRDEDLNALFEQESSEDNAFESLETVDSFSEMEGLDLTSGLAESGSLPLPPPPPVPGESFPAGGLADLFQEHAPQTEPISFSEFEAGIETEAVEDLFQAEAAPTEEEANDPLASLFGNAPSLEGSEFATDLPPIDPNLSMEESLASLFGESAADPTPFPASTETPSELSEAELAALFDAPTEAKNPQPMPQANLYGIDLESDALLEESLMLREETFGADLDDPFADFTLSDDLDENPPADSK